MRALDAGQPVHLTYIANDARRALSRLGEARQLAARIEHDHCSDPGERAAISTVTRSGRVAEHWLDLRAELEAAADRLDAVVIDLNMLVDEELAELAPEAIDDKGEGSMAGRR
jgi:hypothetical protein